MNKSFTAYRYFVFVIFIVCNIALCSVSAWNLTIALAVQFTTSIQVDAVVISIGAAGLLFIFPILFIDALRKDSVTRRVWFECLWVGLFSLLELAAAAAVTTTMSGMECVASVEDGVMKLGPCTPTKLMMAFAWTGTVNLLVYLVILVLVAILHQRDDPLVWKSPILEYDWFAVRSSLGSAPPSPTQPGWQRSLRSARRPGQTEFSKRMMVSRERDVEKQDPDATTPPTAALPIQTEPTLEMSRSSLDRSRPSLDRQRPSLDRQRPSLDRQRPSMDRPRPSLDRSPAPFTPRQFQLSAVPASPASVAVVPPTAGVSSRPSLERPPVTFTPRKLQLSAIPASATVAATPRTPQPDSAVPATAMPYSSTSQVPGFGGKKRILKLHRPPSLDLSKITNNQ